MKRFYLAASALLLSGCASFSGNVTPAYVSPATFASLTCDQLRSEMHDVGERARAAASEQDRRATGDAVRVGLILIAPILIGLMPLDAGDNTSLASLRGTQSAIGEQMVRQNCPSDFQKSEADASLGSVETSR